MVTKMVLHEEAVIPWLHTVAFVIDTWYRKYKDLISRFNYFGYALCHNIKLLYETQFKSNLSKCSILHLDRSHTSKDRQF